MLDAPTIIALLALIALGYIIYRKLTAPVAPASSGSGSTWENPPPSETSV